VKSERPLTPLKQAHRDVHQDCKGESRRTLSGKVQYPVREAFKEVAVQKLRELRDDLAREGFSDVSIHHLVDRICVGDESLIIVVLGTRRKFVFPVLEEAVERVKKEIPI
jgi:molybdopterin synthase catalytic subunit